MEPQIPYLTIILLLVLASLLVYMVYKFLQSRRRQSAFLRDEEPISPFKRTSLSFKNEESISPELFQVRRRNPNSLVFISYSRPDASIAKKLAGILTASGFRVWWDINLVGSDQFRDEIQKNLRAAQAVIVIWSESSVNSRFVRQEADEALHFGKLISTRVRGIAVLDIPLGFREQHTDYVDETAKILAAARKVIAG